MKKLYLYILFIFAASSVFAGAYLASFSAKSENGNIKVEWNTQDETNVKNFVIERKTPQSEWITVYTMSPLGSNHYYSFIDEAAYKTTDAIFNYRLKIVDNDGTVSTSASVSVSHSISGVAKRTWGSIKAMFR